MQKSDVRYITRKDIPLAQFYDTMKKLMIYKGYLGSVAYSEKDQVFFGKIEGINGLVNFEGESVKELTNAFHEAVDDYLAYLMIRFITVMDS